MTSLPTPGASWRKSTRSAAGAEAACVEVTLAVQRPDGSVVVEMPDRPPFVLVPAPDDEVITEQFEKPPTESDTPWTRGSLDESSDLEDLGTPQLGDVHALPGLQNETHEPPLRNVQVAPDLLGSDIGRALRGGDESFVGRVLVPNEAQEHALAQHFSQHGSGLRSAPVLHVEPNGEGLRVVGSSKAPWADEREAYVAQIHQGQGVFTVPLEQRPVRGTGQLDGGGLGQGLRRRPSLSNLDEQAPVVLVSCAAGEVIDGVEGSEPAQAVAIETGRRVYAPTTDVYVSDDGFALVKDSEGNPGVWKEFFPDGRPPRLVTGDIEDIGDEVRELPADTPSLMYSPNQQHAQQMLNPGETLVTANDQGQPTEWVQSFGQYTVHVRRDWTDGHETLSGALIDATTHQVVDQGPLRQLPNGRIQLGVNVYRPDGSPQFTFTDGGVRIPGFQAKADHVLGLLRRQVDIVQFTGGRPVNITLRPSSDRTTWGTPAEVTSNAHSVDVWVADYFFRDYGMPYVMGMLMHEFAVHPMASQFSQVRDESDAYAPQRYRDRATGQVMVDAIPIHIPGFNGTRTISTVPRASGPRKQPDHINVARPNGFRFKVYQRAIFDIALSMQHDSLLRLPGTSRRDARDVMDSYLMDLASIAVTEDNRARGALNWTDVATSYNAYRDLLIQGLGDLSSDDAARLLANVPAPKTATDVFNDYRRMGFTVFSAVVSATARNAMSGLGSMFSSGSRQDPRQDRGEGGSGGAYGYPYLSGTGGQGYIRMSHDGSDTETQDDNAPQNTQLVSAPTSSAATAHQSAPVTVDPSALNPRPQDRLIPRRDGDQSEQWTQPPVGPYVLRLTKEDATGDVTGDVYDARIGRFVANGVPTHIGDNEIGLTSLDGQRSNMFTPYDTQPLDVSWDVSRGVPTLINFDDGGLTIPGFQEKADQVLDVLRRHSELITFMGVRDVNITVKPSTDPATLKSPAEVTAGDDSIEVWVAEYYMRNYSTPYVLGMLAHEFGVHPLASAHEEVREEDSAYSGMPVIVPGLVKGDGTPRFLTTDPRPEGPRKQPDHIMVTKPGGRRFTKYQQVSIAYARLLHDNFRVQKAGSTDHDARDVLDTYLMDLASIAVTEDDRAKGVWSPGEIAQVYNNYRQMLLDSLPEFDPLREQVPDEKTALNVLTDYAGMGFVVGGTAISNRVGAAVTDLGNRLTGFFNRRSEGGSGGAVQMAHEPDFTQDHTQNLESHEPGLDTMQSDESLPKVKVAPDLLGSDIGRALRGGNDDFLGRVFVPNEAQERALAQHFEQHGSGLRSAPVLHVEPSDEGLRVVGSSKAPWADEREAYVAQIHQGQGVFTVPLEQRPSRGTGQLDGGGLGQGLRRRPSLSSLDEQAPVVLVSCAAGEVIDGVEGSEPAQAVAIETGRRVYAPTTDVYVSDDGFALIADEQGRPGVWKEFFPDGRPPRLVTGDIEDIGDEVRELPADTPSLMYSSNQRRAQQMLGPNETLVTANDHGQPTEWVQSFGAYTVHVTRDWSDGHETLYAALYDARTHELVDSGVLAGLQNGRVRLQDRTGDTHEYRTRSDGSPQFRFTDGGVRITGFQERADHVLGLLRRHDEIVQFTNGRPVNITLKSNSETVTWQTPAEVHAHDDSIDVWLAEYYFKNYSMPYIMGMLMHEFAVHPVASADSDVQSESNAYAPYQYRDRATSQMVVDAAPIQVPGLGQGRTISTMPRTSGPRKQADHINVSRLNGYRFKVYQRTVLDLALTMQHDSLRRMPNTSPTDARDLIDCYLMDLASIAATEDNRAQGVLSPNDIARAYNAYRGALLESLHDLPVDDAAAIRANVPAPKTAANVLGAYAGMGFTVAGAAMVGSVGNALSGLGGMFRGPRPGPGGAGGSSRGYLAPTGDFGFIRMGHDGPDLSTLQIESAPHEAQLLDGPDVSAIVHELIQVPPLHEPLNELPSVTQFDPGSAYELTPPRFGSAPAGVGFAHANWARSWGLEFDPEAGTVYDALLSAGGGSLSIGGRTLADAEAVRQALGGRIGTAVPSLDDWSAAAESLGASVLILHGDGTMSAHGEGPALILAEAGPADAQHRWSAVTAEGDGQVFSGLSAAQVEWAASEGRRFADPQGGFFEVLAQAGRANGIPELDFAPQVLRDRLVDWMQTGLSDADWGRVLTAVGIPGPHDAAVQQRIIEDVQRGEGGPEMQQLLPLLADVHFHKSIEVVRADGEAYSRIAQDTEPAVTLVPTGTHDSWFRTAEVRPPLSAGAATRPADVAGGLGWAEPTAPVTPTTDHLGPEPSDAQHDWAYDHGRQLVQIPSGPDARYEAILRAVGSGFTTKGEYVTDPVRLRELIADEVGPTLAQDAGLSLVVHTIYAAHTPSSDTRIDSGRAQAEIIEAIRNPEYRPELADALVPYFANRLGLGVRTVDPSGVVGRYGSGRPTYLTWTTDAGGQRHWAAAPSDTSRYPLGSPLRSPNRSDPALFLLTQAIEARKNALRVGGTSEFGSDPVIRVLRDAQNRWLEHGPAPRPITDQPIGELWHPENLAEAADQLTQTMQGSVGGTRVINDVALGSGLHTAMAIELFDGLFPQGIGHESGVGTATEGGRGVTGLPADQWVVASLPEVLGVLPPGGAALLLGGGRAVVVVDTPQGPRLVGFGTDGLGGPITGRVEIPDPAIHGTGDGLALVIDREGHPLATGRLPDTLGYELDSASGWKFGPGFEHADPETGAPAGASSHQAAWAQEHGVGFGPARSGMNGPFHAAIEAAGGVLSGHGVEVTNPVQLRQALATHLSERLSTPDSLRDFPSILAAFTAEGPDRVFEEFFDQHPADASPRAVAKQLEEHIASGKAARYIAQAMAEPGHWEHIVEAIAPDVIADWAGLGVLTLDPHGQVRLHGDPSAERIALGRIASPDTDVNAWFALTPEHSPAEPFGDVAPHSASSLTAPTPHTVTEGDAFYRAVLDASGGAIQIDRDTVINTPDELKQQLTKFLLDRPDLLDTSARESIERETGIGKNAGIDELIDHLADPSDPAGQVVARHVIGSYLGKELNVVESDGSSRSYGTGLPVTITDIKTGEGQSHWSALPLESHESELDRSQGQEIKTDSETDRVAQSQWAPEAYTNKAPDEAEVEDPWRSATFCVEMEIDGQMQKACVSVAVLTLDADLAAELGVPLP